MADRVENILTTCGREAGRAELEHAQEVVRLCRGLSRYELALTLCEHWGWVSPTGGLQQRACEKLLEKWEEAGHLRLPEKDASKQRQSKARKPIASTRRTAAQEPVACALAEIQPVWLEVVSGRDATALWSEFVNRYHPLKSKKMIFVRPLTPDFRAQLGSPGAMATRCEEPEQEQKPRNAGKPVVAAPPAKRSGSGEKRAARAGRR